MQEKTHDSRSFLGARGRKEIWTEETDKSRTSESEEEPSSR